MDVLWLRAAVGEMLDLHFFRRRSVRMVRQIELAECGLACLAMVANYHGRGQALQDLRRRFPPSHRGTNIAKLMSIADQIGFLPRALKVPLDELRLLTFPAILHWNLKHFVVAERASSRGVMIHNPDGHSRWYSWNDLSLHFSGIALELRPSSEKQEPLPTTNTLRIRELFSGMGGILSVIVQVLTMTLIIQIASIATPYFMQVALDNTISIQSVDFLLALAAGFGIISVVGVAAGWLRSFTILTASSQANLSIASNTVRKLFRLPISWFERRHLGDILSRFSSIQPIQQLILEKGIISIIDGIFSISVMILMFFYNTLMTLIALLAILTYVFTRIIFFRYAREAKQESIVSHGREQSFLIESIRGILSLRLFGAETKRFSAWQAKMVDALNGDIRTARIQNWESSLCSLIMALQDILIIFISVIMISRGDMTIGMTFAFIAYKQMFISRIFLLVDQYISFKMLGLHLDRLSDIVKGEEDWAFNGRSADRELKGGITVDNVSFRYSSGDNLVLRNISMEVFPGDHVALTGASGSGKSTLLKLIGGIEKPTQGSILIDGEPMEEFGIRSFHQQISVISQNDNLFSGTIASNIALFEEIMDIDRVHSVAQDAAIHDDIMAMPMKYDTQVSELGSTLSGGQKQRIILARALYRNPKILLIDEGTAHLDLVREMQVNQAIKRLGITRIIIAHRTETINSADRIYIMEDGSLICDN